MKVECLYTCNECDVYDKVLVVRERLPDEDIMHWMRHVQYAAAFDHGETSPRCPAETLTHLKIPLRADPDKDPDVRIGEARRQ